MDLNLNFGEHFYEASSSSLFYDLLMTFFGAFLGFLVALWINRLIEKKNNKNDKKKLVEEYQSHLRYLSLLLKSILKTYPKQAENYKKLSAAVIKKPLEIELPELRATYDLSRLKDLDSKELRDAYLYFFQKDKNSIDNYKKIFAHVDFLLMLFNDLIKQNENHRNFTHKDQLFVRDCFEEASYRLGLKQKNIRKENPDNYQKNKEFQYLHNFSLVFIDLTKDTIDFSIIRDKYLQPLHETILYEISDTEFADSIFIIIKKAISRLRNIEFNSLEFARDMKNVESSIKEPLKYLTEIYQKINKNEP